MSQHVSVLLLGSNLGEKEKNIELALQELQDAGCEIIQRTDICTSIPVEFDSYNNFCNIATSIKTHFSPVILLEKIKSIEQKMGRKSDSKALGKFEDRIIDIDIVSFDKINFISDMLVIPHISHLVNREFSKTLLIELDNLNIKHNT